MKVTYLKTRLSSVLNITKIVTVHHFQFDETFAYPGERHDFWEMVYVDRGRVAALCGGEEKILSQGNVVFHAPNEFHAIRSYRSAPDFFIISFVCNSEAMRFFAGYHAPLPQSLRPFLTAALREAEGTYVIPENDPYARGLTRRETAEIGGEQMIKTYLEQLMIQLMRQRKRDVPVFPSRREMESHLLAVVKQYIERRIREPVCIADICEEIGYSKTYLCRLFHAQSGETVGRYVTRRKIECAKDLIREGTRNMAEISDLLSFDNPQYFCRVFRRVTGMSPTEFKKSLEI